jgi:hypothetical protein
MAQEVVLHDITRHRVAAALAGQVGEHEMDAARCGSYHFVGAGGQAGSGEPPGNVSERAVGDVVTADEQVSTVAAVRLNVLCLEVYSGTEGRQWPYVASASVSGLLSSSAAKWP